MTSIASTTINPPAARPWWREPYVWLVISGPLVVVVAGITTLVIAVKNPDPVLDRNIGAKATFSHAPASQARNHATTATIPAKP